MTQDTPNTKQSDTPKYSILLQIGKPDDKLHFRASYYINEDFKPYIDIVSPDGKKWTFEFVSRYTVKKDDVVSMPEGMVQLVYRYKESS